MKYHVIGGVILLFAAFCGYIIFNSLPSIPPLIVLAMIGLIAIAIIVMVDPIRDLVANRLTKFTLGGKSGLQGTFRVPEKRSLEEKPAPPTGDETILRELEERGRKQNTVAELVEVFEQLAPPIENIWGWAIAEAKNNNYTKSQTILTAGLTKHSDDPRLLITSGAVSSKLRKTESALQAYRKAITVSEDKPEFIEQYYLANSNLCFLLALLKQHQDEAIKAGKKSSDHADQFENRDSFRINYGFALLQFANDDKSLLDAMTYLIQLHQYELSPEERLEVNGYIVHGAKQLPQEKPAS